MSGSEGWSQTNLGAVISGIRAGFSANGEERPRERGERGVLKTGAVLGGRFDPTQQKVVGEQADQLRVPVIGGTIILGRKNSAEMVGASVFVEHDHPGLFLSDLLWEITPAEGVDALWLAFALQEESTRERIRLSATGTQSTMKNLSRNVFLGVPVAVPSLPEQRKIAEILSTWDDAIKRTTALREAITRQRDWLRNSLLSGTGRLPAHTTAWKTVRLSEVLTEHKSRSTGAEDVFSVSVHKGLVNQIEHLGRSFAAAKTSHYNLVKPGDIVYTKSPTGDFPLGVVKQSAVKKDVIVSPLYGVFSPVTEALGSILDSLFESPIHAQNYLNSLVQKGAKNTIAITNSRFLEGTLNLPTDPEEQRELAAIMKTSAGELILLTRKLDLLRTQKRGLMQKLLTGEVRVPLDTKQMDSADV